LSFLLLYFYNSAKSAKLKYDNTLYDSVLNILFFKYKVNIE